MTAIELTGVTKRFGSITAVDDLSLRVGEGSVYGFAGPNGAGKTTTIRMLLGLSRPTTGSVRVFGRDPHERAVRHRVAYLPAELRFDDRLTVAATLDVWTRLRRDVDVAYRDELCERLQLDPSRHTRTLSTGNRRKVGIVGAFMSRPDLLVLDEPTSGLDPLLQQEFLSLVGQARQAGATVLLSSHVLSEIEAVADSVAVIRAGRLVAHGTMGELLARTDREIRVRLDVPAFVPPEIEALPGCRGVRLHTDDVIAISWVGPVRPLLEELVRLPVVGLLAPEPNLDQAFRSYYAGDRETAADAAPGHDTGVTRGTTATSAAPDTDHDATGDLEVRS